MCTDYGKQFLKENRNDGRIGNIRFKTKHLHENLLQLHNVKISHHDIAFVYRNCYLFTQTISVKRCIKNTQTIHRPVVLHHFFQELASLLYQAGRTFGCVDPEKVHDVLGITPSVDDETQATEG